MKKLIAALIISALALPAFSQIVTTNLVIHYGLDTTDNDVWEELVGLFPNNDRMALNRTGASDLPTLGQVSSATNGISAYYDFQIDNSGQVMHLNILNGQDSYNDTIGAGFDLRNTSFEIWFRPNDATTPRQILWETGGGTGTSFTLNTTNLQLRTRSNNRVANVVTDISTEIASGDWIQAVGNIDFAANSIELFVNGASVGTGTAPGNISDWDGGDGDGLGGQGGVNLGGFGGAYTFNGGEYGAFNGQISIFRIYEDVNAANGTGPLLSAADVLQNYNATRPGDAIFTDLSAGPSNWTNPTNWFNNVAPTNYVDVFVGGTFTALIDSVIPDVINRVTLGHAEGTANGNGNLRLDAGALTVDDNLNVGSGGSTGILTLNSGTIDVGGDLIYGVTANGGGEVNLFSGSVLNVAGDIRERVTSVGAAQLYLDGGELNVDGDIVVQSFRTGNLAGRTGSYTLKDGKRLDNTGTFFVGRLGAGTFTIEDGSLHLDTGGNDIRIAAESSASSGILNVNHPNARVEVTAPRFLELGLLGNGRMNLFDGTINSGITRFGQNGGGGVLNIQGGRFVAQGDIRTGANALQSAVNLSGGVLDLSPNAASYRINDLSMQDAASIRFQARPGGITPLNVASNANLTAGSIEVLDPPAAGASVANTTTWVGMTDTWDADGTKWQNNLGSPGIPAVASGVIYTGAVFDVMTSTAGTINGAANLTAGADWEVFSPDANTASIRRTGSILEGGPALAIIDDAASVVTRSEDLRIYNAAGADASRLNVLDGTLTLAPGSELILGGSTSGILNHDGGMTTVETLRYGTGLGGFGGDVNLRGGVLHVTGDIVETSPNVNGAQMYIDDGTLIADGNITVQSFRTGQSAGANGSYVQTNGQVIVNTGTFVIGSAGNGTHYLDDGKIIVKNNFVMGDAGGSGVLNIGRPGISPYLSVSSDNPANANSAFDIGDQGPAIVNLTNGVVLIEEDIDFGRSNAGGGGLLHVAGGSFTATRELNVAQATNAVIHLEGGALELVGNNDVREIRYYMHSNAVLRIGANDAAGDSTPLTVISNGVFGAGALVDLVGAQVGLADIATNAVTWIGGNDTWDADTNKWTNPLGAAYLPSNGQGFIPTGTVYNVITGANLVDTNLILSANPDLVLVSPAANTLGLRVSGAGFGGLPVTAIVDDPASIITRNGNLTISPEALADAAQLIHSNGTLNVSGDLGLGGTQYGLVHQDAGDISITGDLLFGPTFAATRGGTYNLNGGSLTVNAITEAEVAVDSAQFHWNGGTLDVADSIIVQRFAVAETQATNLSAIVTVPVMATGGFVVGGSSNAVGQLTLRGADLLHRPRSIRLGQFSNSSGTLIVEDGTVIGGPDALYIAGESEGDSDTEGHLIVGTDGGPGPYMSSNGGNVEVGRAGNGTLTLKSGTFEQLGSNLVLGQYAGSSGTFNIEGGTYRLTNPASDFNMNTATGVVNQTGGTLEIPRTLNMGNNAVTSLYEYNLDGGLLTIGANLDYRNNGTDTFNLNGGSLVFTNGAGTILANRTGNNIFSFTDGLLKNCGRFEGALVQQGGVLDIGASAGSMTVLNDYTGQAGATLKVELDYDPANGPAQPGVDFDQLVVNGNADISGMTLDVSVLNPAINNAAAGTFFRILDTTALIGTFAGSPLIDVGGTPFFVIHNSDSVELMLFTTDPTKDTDLDGVPDLQELAFGTDASDAATGPEALPKIERVDENTVRVLYRAQTASPLPLTYDVTTTTDLSVAIASWAVLGAGAPSAVQPAGLPAGVVQMELDLTIDPDETRYYRVRVNL